MTVELVYDDDCPNVDQARGNLRRALAEVGLPASWAERETSAPDVAASIRNLGSPTVLVNGRDVAGAEAANGACCRVYEAAGAGRGAPPAALIVRALAAAMAEERAGERPWTPALLATALALAVCLAGFTAWSPAGEPPARPAIGTVAIPIEGMVCASCVARVKKALRAVDGVSDVEVSLEHRNARVRYATDEVDPGDLVAVINSLGYKAGPPAVGDGAP